MKRTGWTFLVLVLGIATGLALSRQPWREFAEQKSVSDVTAQDMRKAEQERAELARQSAAAQSPTGREALARERGYHRPDETPAETVR